MVGALQPRDCLDISPTETGGYQVPIRILPRYSNGVFLGTTQGAFPIQRDKSDPRSWLSLHVQAGSAP
jgi:hypothetical protein